MCPPDGWESVGNPCHIALPPPPLQPRPWLTCSSRWYLRMRCTGFSRKLCRGSEWRSWAWRSCNHMAAGGDSASSRSRARELGAQHGSAGAGGRAGRAQGMAKVQKWSGPRREQGRGQGAVRAMHSWKKSWSQVGWGQGRGAGGTATRTQPSRGFWYLTSGSSCSTMCRCQNPRSATDRGVRKTPVAHHSHPGLPMPPPPLQPGPGFSSCLTHPLYEALSNAPCSATTL